MANDRLCGVCNVLCVLLTVLSFASCGKIKKVDCTVKNSNILRLVHNNSLPFIFGRPYYNYGGRKYNAWRHSTWCIGVGTYI